VAASEAVWEANSSEKMDDGSVGDDGGRGPDPGSWTRGIQQLLEEAR
jgi:hypothetical protein